ncbi:hypothetical protein HPULCUR_008854 [Helicostylum pulchrum]|uniref:Uncharacterized protein n=1 Tax=Helicostylum pulchrum TaxID=562976 RepID=A0ABP9Y9T4_9FUNG
MDISLKDLAPPNSCPPDAFKIKDTLTNTVVTITEWISSELYRIQNDVRPRHCENYEQLTEIIVDTRLLEPLRVAPPLLPIHADQEIIYMDQDVYDDDDDNDNEEEEEEEDTDEDQEDQEDEAEEEENEEEQDETIQEDIPVETNNNNTIHNKIIPTSCIKINNTRLKTYGFLCRVFIEIMRYCSRAGTSTNAPRLFLNEFEKLCQEVKLGNTVNAIAFRENLLKILFGKIQMAEQLVQCWKFACEWVTGALLNTQKNALYWIEINLNAYIAAQRVVISEHIFMRKCLQDQIRRNSEPKLSSDIAICKK